MSSFSNIILLFAITFFALFMVSMINRRQMRSRLLNQKLGQMKRRATELEELSVTIETLVENIKVAKTINAEAIDILERMLNTAPGNTFYQLALESSQQRAEALDDPSRKVVLFRLMESDASIARSQYALSEAARVIRKQQADDRLQVAEMDTLLQDLAWANYMIKITSNVAQGHKAVNRGDILRAFAYYRKAMEVSTESGHKDSRQNQIISEIGDILNSKRRILSPSIMPETLYNPEKDSPTLAEMSQKDSAGPDADGEQNQAQ